MKTRKLTALALAGVVALGVLGTAQSAAAEEIPGTVTLTPTTGNVEDETFLERLQVNAGCPTGFRAISGTVGYQNGVRLGSIGNIRTPATPATDGTTGLDGGPIDLNRFINPTNSGVSDGPLTSRFTLQNGDWELRVYCFASPTSPQYTDPYFSIDMTFNAATGVWAVKGAVVEVPAQPTTTSLTALFDASDNTVDLTATVKDSTGATATGAAGTIEFAEGATVVGTAPVAAGVASFTTPEVSVGSHTYTAKFIPADPTAFATSTSATATIVRPAGPAAPGSTVIDVTIPTGTGALTFAGLQATISLGTATLTDGKFVASGQLGPVVVTDTRQLGSSAWSLTGVTTDFVDGSKVIDGKYLGWTPSLVGTSNAGVAGAAVVPGTGSGLKAPSALSTGSVVDGITTTTVGAQLNLAAPGNTPGGFYTSTLTLTLI